MSQELSHDLSQRCLLLNVHSHSRVKDDQGLDEKKECKKEVLLGAEASCEVICNRMKQMKTMKPTTRSLKKR